MKIVLTALLALLLLERYIVATREPVAHRCDGDLIVSEMGGHKVEMFRWLK